MNAPPVLQHNNAASSLRIYIECHNLLDTDVFSKSDPFCCLRLKNSTQPAFQEIGRTERMQVQMNNLNPKFAKTFDIMWQFEIRQDIEIHVYDWDTGDVRSCDVNKQDFLGSAKTQISSIVGSPGMQLVLPMERDGRVLLRSKMILRAEKLGEAAGEDFNLQLAVKGRALAKKDWFGKSDPYLQFCRLRPDGTFDIVHSSEVVKNTLDPVWRPFSLQTSKLAASLDSNFRINVIDWDAIGSHDPIGHIIMTPKRFVQAITAKEALKITHYKGKAKDVGHLVFDGSTAVPITRFIDFLSGGLEMRMFVAVDFTASNGMPGDPRSLHHMRPGYFNEYKPEKKYFVTSICAQTGPNRYQQAIATIGDILQSYDSSKLFAAYGFGGLVRNVTSHCFALNGVPESPCVQRVQGILDAYEKALLNVGLSGPTNFAPVVSTVAQAVQSFHQGYASGLQRYGILLILTDGQITDMSDTMAAIARAALLPLSIIIVGVGSENFENMNVLDGDDRPFAVRDIVQFVPFQRFRGNSVLLAAEVLAEVPDQVVRYMFDNKIAARPPVMAPQVAVAASVSQAPSAPPLTPTTSTVVPASFVALPPPPGPPPPALLPPLQQGWSEILDPASQRLYYVNLATQQTTWTRPDASGSMPPPPPPPQTFKEVPGAP